MHTTIGKRILLIGLVLSVLCSFAGCGKNNVPVTENTNGSASKTTGGETGTGFADGLEASCVLKDAIGREITVVPGSYTRIVCIGAGALRMYSYIGELSLLCGVEDIDNLSLENRPKMFDEVARPYVLASIDLFSTLPSCGTGGPNAQTMEAERILACNPDLIISAYEDADKARALEEQTGVPVVTLRTGASGIFGEEFRTSVNVLGTVLGKENRAEELLAFIESEIAEIKERTDAVPESEEKAAYIAGLGNWGTTNHLYTSPNYDSFTVANIRNVLEGRLTGGVQKIEEELFVSVGDEIDLLFLDQAAVKNIRPLYAQDPELFDSVKAWQEGNVYLQPAYNAYYTNFETTLANVWFLAKCAYPARFEDVDMTEKYNEISMEFLGAELAEEVAAFGGYQKIDTRTFFSE